jgi:hypothetical protein
MANNHHIVAARIMHVLQKHTLDQSGELTEFDTITDRPIDHDVPQLECTCGEEFDGPTPWESARQHLEDIELSSNGESVTRPE